MGSPSEYLIMFGQSNCEGRTASPPYNWGVSPNKFCQIYDEAENRFNTIKWGVNTLNFSNSYGMEIPISFGWKSPLSIIKVAVGATGLVEPEHWAIGGVLTERLISACKKAFSIKRPTKIYVLMNQWEYDARTDADSAAYNVNLLALFDYLQDRIGVEFDVIGIVEANPNITARQLSRTQAIQTAQANFVAADTSKRFLLNQDSFISESETTDGIHVDHPTMTDLGDKWINEAVKK